MPVLVIPLLSTLAIGVIMLIVVGKPITGATTGLTNVLNGLTGTNAILLGLLLGRWPSVPPCGSPTVASSWCR